MGSDGQLHGFGLQTLHYSLRLGFLSFTTKRKYRLNKSSSWFVLEMIRFDPSLPRYWPNLFYLRFSSHPPRLSGSVSMPDESFKGIPNGLSESPFQRLWELKGFYGPLYNGTLAYLLKDASKGELFRLPTSPCSYERDLLKKDVLNQCWKPLVVGVWLCCE